MKHIFGNGWFAVSRATIRRAERAMRTQRDDRKGRMGPALDRRTKGVGS